MEGTVTSVSPDTLVSFLSCQAESTLVVDCRPFMAYNEGHVLEAVNVHCPPILKRRSGGFVALENIVVDEDRRERLLRGQYGRLVAYDQSTEDLNSADRDSSLYAVLKSLMQQVQLDSVFYLVGGYDAFSQECPLLCVTQQFSPLSAGRPDQQPHTSDDDQPVEILPHLFLGNGHHSSRWEVLQRLGVTALVNASASCPNHFPSRFRYLNIPVQDTASEDLASWFPDAIQFIDGVQAAGGRVLVHCQAGKSRSATVCLAYLIKTLNLSLDSAFEHVRSRRKVIDPNLNFMRQLQDYRQRLDSDRLPCTDAAAALSVASLPPPPVSSVSSGSSFASSGSTFLTAGSSSVSSGSLFVFSGTSSMSSPSSGPCAIPSLAQTPREASAPITLPSTSSQKNNPPASSAADMPPPSPATANDVHCFFVFSSTDLPFPSSSLARTPEILLPS